MKTTLPSISISLDLSGPQIPFAIPLESRFLSISCLSAASQQRQGWWRSVGGESWGSVSPSSVGHGRGGGARASRHRHCRQRPPPHPHPLPHLLSWLLPAELSRQASARRALPGGGGRHSLSSVILARPTLPKARQGCAGGHLAHGAAGGKGVWASMASPRRSSIHDNSSVYYSMLIFSLEYISIECV
jgi:hypothetical protein